MNTSINELKKEIMNHISSTITTVQDVADYHKVNFRGFPAVTITMAENDNEFWSVSENQRAFNFDCDIYVQISRNIHGADDTAMKTSERIMGNVVSELIDSFDSFITFNDAANYIKASPSSWDYAEVGEGYCRHARIKLQVVKLRMN
jgi:hypothetical protein